MKILVSSCLPGENCKYNGKNNLNEKVAVLAENNTLIPVCPEVLGGLSVPRKPCEINNGKVITKEGTDVDLFFRHGAQKALEIALNEHIDFAILKSRSPSCGKDFIYDGTFRKKLCRKDGVFAAMLKENNIQIKTEEEL